MTWSRKARTPALALLCVLLWLASPAAGAADSDLLRVEVFPSHEQIRGGESFRLAVVAHIKSGIHINSREPTTDGMVATALTFQNQAGIAMGPIYYPPPVLKSYDFSPGKVPILEGNVTFVADGRVSQDAPLGVMRIAGELSYQACDGRTCFMPETVRFESSLRIVGMDAPVKKINDDLFSGQSPLSGDEIRAKAVLDRGMVYAAAAFFLFGIALNLTPCVYPVIPMTVSYFGGQGGQRKRRIFALSLYYVAGIALIFSILGLVSGLAGQQWGFLFQSPWFVVFVGVFLLAMAASMFGAFEIAIPSSIMTVLGKSRQGALGALVMGLTVGVVIAPCAAGVLLGLVGLVARLGMAVKGGLLFFVMGLGLGLPYLFLAMCSGLLTRLPRSGMWMVWVRKVFGVLLIAVAVHFLAPLGKQVPDQEYFYLGVLGIFGGLFLGFLEHAEGYARTFRMIRRVFGVSLIVLGLFLVNHSLRPATGAIAWIHYKGQSLDQMLEGGKPTLIDLWADWCTVCKQLDRDTFSDERVAEMATAFKMVKVNFTLPDSAIEALRNELRVTGLPTLVFFDARGKELHDLRATGFIDADEMLSRMEAARRR